MSEQLITTPGTFGENGNFLLERQLGDGGMGGVYMGRDKMLDRPVAVKVMLKEYGEDAEFVEKFKKEAQAAARLIHPNIAQIYSYGICDGMPYIAMELVSGGSLHQLMLNTPGKTDVTRVMKICEQVAQALRCAADQGLVHGDVKPENVLLDYNGNAKLVDFGLAAMQKDTNEIWGTPYYISPEKVRKEPVDFRADLYSLGGTLYHALTGVAPFEGEDSVAVVKKRFDGAPKKPSEIRPELSPQIDALVLKMLALDKEERFPTFEALLEEFKNVMANGIGTSTTVSAPVAKATTVRTATGTRAAMMRTRRTAMMTRTRAATAVKRKLEGEEGNEGEIAPDAKAAVSEDEEDEGGGNLGLKVVGVIVGVIVLIAAVVGGLIWYQVADKKAREAEVEAQIAAGVSKGRDAISDTAAMAEKFAREFNEFAEKAIVECQKPTDELSKILPAEIASQLKIGPTKELLDAIASTNEVAASPAPAAPASTNAAPAAVTNAPAAKAAAAATNAPAAKAASPAAEKKAADEKPQEEKPKDQVVITMNELWERAYSCQASAVRICHEMRKIRLRAEETLKVQESTREAMEKLGAISRELLEKYEEVKSSKDVENVRKGITFIKTKGESTVRQTIKRIRIEKLEADRKAKAEAAAAAEKERKEKLEAERKELVESERQAALDKFEALVAQGVFRQLDWESALRQFKNLKAEMKTPEGELAVGEEMRKVEAMKAVQEIFMRNLKRGHEFRRGKLKGGKVTDANKSDIKVVRGKKTVKVTWMRFYKEYNPNLTELIMAYVVKGRDNGSPRLNLRSWAEAMSGAALTLRVICSEEETSASRAEQLVKEVADKYADYLPHLKAMFPDIEFTAASEE